MLVNGKTISWCESSRRRQMDGGERRRRRNCDRWREISVSHLRVHRGRWKQYTAE